MVRIPKIVSQIDMSASSISYILGCPSAIWHNTLLNSCIFCVRKSAFSKWQYLYSQAFKFRGIFKFISWNAWKSMATRSHFLGLAVGRKWYCPQHIVASTLPKPRFWGTIFRIPPTVCTNRISTLSKLEFWTTRVQDLQNTLTNQTWESIVSLLRCRFVTTVSQILTLCMLSSSSWWCLVILLGVDACSPSPVPWAWRAASLP